MFDSRHFISTFLIVLFVTVSACSKDKKSNPQCESKPKYYNSFKLPNRLLGYNNYEQARLCAKKNDKPLAVYFTNLACKNCENFEKDFLNSKEVAYILNNHFIFVQLYVDDKTLLPLRDQFEMTSPLSKKKRTIKTIGDLNLTLLPKYSHGSQPALFITNKKDSVISLIGYNPNSEELIGELNLALKILKRKSPE